MLLQKGKRQAQAGTQEAPGEGDGNKSVVPINQEHQRFPESIQKLGKRPGEDFFPQYWLKEPSSPTY